MNRLRGGALSVLALAALPCCGSAAQRAPDTVTPQVMSVALEGASDPERPMDAYSRLFEQLRVRAANEVADGADRPLKGAKSWGMKGDKVLTGAVTPRRGIFYIVDAGPYRPGSSRPALLREETAVCRFEVDWSAAPFDDDPRSLLWAEGVFPGPDCTAANKTAIARLEAWREAGTRSTFATLGQSAESQMRAWLVREQPAPGSPSRPFDPRGAVEKVAGDDPVIRTVPLPGVSDMSAFVILKSGRTFASFPDGFTSTSRHGVGCVVENLAWNDIAMGPQAAPMQRAARLCARLQRQAKAS